MRCLKGVLLDEELVVYDEELGRMVRLELFGLCGRTQGSAEPWSGRKDDVRKETRLQVDRRALVGFRCGGAGAVRPLERRGSTTCRLGGKRQRAAVGLARAKHRARANREDQEPECPTPIHAPSFTYL